MERRKTGKIGLIRAPQSQQPWPENGENPAVLVSGPGDGEITPQGDWRRKRSATRDLLRCEHIRTGEGCKGQDWSAGGNVELSPGPSGVEVPLPGHAAE